jgi:hypothetical protein
MRQDLEHLKANPQPEPLEDDQDVPESMNLQDSYEDKPKRHRVDILCDLADGHLTPEEAAKIRLRLLTNNREPDPLGWMR